MPGRLATTTSCGVDMGIAEGWDGNVGKFEVDPMVRNFVDGKTHIKRMELPAGYKALKHKHSYNHFSILSEGKALVRTDTTETEYRAGDCILIAAGVNHEIVALEDIVWFCIHSGDHIDTVLLEG